MNAVPPVDAAALVRVRDLRIAFPTGDGAETVKAIDGISFEVRAGETFGIIGESGSGKTTLGRALVSLLQPSGGSIELDGVDLRTLSSRRLRDYRRQFQIIFQDPHAALNPRQTILASVREPLQIAGGHSAAEVDRIALDALVRVGIAPEQAFENYRRSVEESLADSRGDMLDLAKTAPDSPTDDPGSLGIRLVRSGQIVGVVSDAFELVEEELIIAVRAPMVLGPSTEKDLEMMRRGVKLRYLIDKAVLADPNLGPQLVANAEETNGAVRFIDNVPLRFMVMDGRTAMIELAEEDGSTMGLVVPNRGLAENMRLLFDGLWDQAKTIDQLPEGFRQAVLARG